MAKSEPKAERAVRARVRGEVRGVGLRAAAVDRAAELGVLGWVRHDPGGDADVLVHAEGDRDAVAELLAFLGDGPAGAVVTAVEVEEARPEGHEQFAVRGVSAGAFVVSEREGSPRFELRLEVAGRVRAWGLPKGPSMDPAVKRMAFEAGEADPGGGAAEEVGSDGVAWDRGTYEQGGRVAWREAIERGHAVFVLHGEKLEGGFALQRIRGGPTPQWLLIKRKDEWAEPGSDVVAERPEPAAD